jgi:hypothetical protein
MASFFGMSKLAIREFIRSIARFDSGPSRAIKVAQEDDRMMASSSHHRFSLGKKPVIRWIKGDGLDDAVTRAAIGQASRLFGDKVDYCLCTNGIKADRVWSILEWAVAPVEWWPLSSRDNPSLAESLSAAGCPPEHYGYWWKWFPERVRPDAPEWILDGDMVITGIPSWFKQWALGKDKCRVTQDDRWPMKDLYGNYVDCVDEQLRLYSGLISLPPGLCYMPEIKKVLAARPLNSGHDGQRDMCEQGVIATAFQSIGVVPIPLYEFPFGRAFEGVIDYGVRGDQGAVWGYHFGHAFRRDNPHFNRLVEQGVVFSRTDKPNLIERFAWMGGGIGQWGVPGWSMPDGCASLIVERARDFAGRQVLELGTSRGRITAMLSSIGCRVTTVDRHDRGVAQNLNGLAVNVVADDAIHFLTTTSKKFDLIVVDLHGNSVTDWMGYAPLLKKCLSSRGTLIIDNATLWKIPEWKEETGVRWFIESLPSTWTIELHPEPLPGVAILTSNQR